MNVHIRSNRLWGCVWDGRIDETEIEGGKSEKIQQSISRNLRTTMSKSVAPESTEYNESGKTGGERRAEDEENENEEGTIEVPRAESLPISTVVSTVPARTGQFMHTPEFRRRFVEFFPGDTLLTLRLATKVWKAAADVFIDEGVESGEIIFTMGRTKVFDYRIIHDDVKINWQISLLQLSQSRERRTPPHKPSRNTLSSLPRLLRTKIDDDPGLASNAWL